MAYRFVRGGLFDGLLGGAPGGGTRGRGLRRALGGGLLALAAAALPISVGPALAHQTAAYTHDGETGETNPTWMSKVPDTARLSHLSIPGTHDTGARDGGDAVEAQSMDIPAQLQAGIRAFDIRLGKAAGCDDLTNDLQIIHGDTKGFRFCQPDTFADVLSAVDAFLTQHPSETLLMRVSQETPQGPSKDDFARIVNQRLQALNANRIYQGANANPTLQEIRGKIVVLTQYGTDAVPAWPGNIRWGDADKQDAYRMSQNWDLAAKWNNSGGGANCDSGSETPNSCNNVVYQFRKAIDVGCDPRVSEECGGSTLYVNHLSAVYPTGFPYFFASGHSNPASGAPRLATLWTRGAIDTCSGASQCLNRQYYPSVDCIGESVGARTCTVPFEGLNILAARYINASESGWLWRTGIVFADFPGPALISAIIGVNTRRFHHGQFDVGVIPASATGCSKPEDTVTIFLDNEDDDNANNAGGWLGGISIDNGGTTFRFCRVDGSKFRPFAGAANARNLDYAVLRLGDACPAGSIEFVRHFDDEDEDNTDRIVGDAWPNPQAGDTDLHFCLFRPTINGANPSVDSLPTFANLPFGYGVFAPSGFLGDSLAQENRGFVYLDDEDYHNANSFTVPQGVVVSHIVDGSDNTTIILARVTFGGGQCFGAPNGSGCDDGNLCTRPDECFGQHCSGSFVTCSDTVPDQCHLAAVCDPTTGGCVNPAAADGTTCNDDDPCTFNDHCRDGTCAGTSRCQAPDSCHLNATCDPITLACHAALPVADGTPCEDGIQCTVGDQCVAGQCRGTDLPNETPCNDGNACSTADVCYNRICSGQLAAAGTPCNDHNVCTKDDACDGLGFVCSGIATANGSPCDDQDPCTVEDTCAGGACQHAFAPNDTLCEDGDACTTEDKCQAGQCQTGATYLCAVAATPVATATPSPSATPTITSTPNQCAGVPNGGSCDDGDACTTNDECVAGFCSGSAVICSAQDECHTAGTCDPNSGLCFNPIAPNATACDDGDPCTTNDQCSAGTCAGVGICTATPTLVVTVPVATSTVTATPDVNATSTATATAGGPTPCPERTQTGAPACAGDCNGDRTVKVNELIVGVTIALGTTSVCDCPEFDRDSDSSVTISEIIAAVNFALGTCPS